VTVFHGTESVSVYERKGYTVFSALLGLLPMIFRPDRCLQFQREVTLTIERLDV
jgi:hypothetical protein